MRQKIILGQTFRSARVIFLLFAFSLFSYDCSYTFKESLYFLERGETLRDITERIFEQTELPGGFKTAFRKQKRQFYVFSYPSNGLQIKGMISFVSRPGPKPLIVFLRDGAKKVGLPAFGCCEIPDELASLSNATIVLGIYRDGVNPGTDQFGGKEAQDVLHLVEYLPYLAEELQISFETGRRSMIGLGRGAMEMFLAFSRYPKLCGEFDRVISLSGLLDLNLAIEEDAEFASLLKHQFRYDGSQEWIDKRNPLIQVSSIPCLTLPILLIQGTADPFLSLEQGYAMLAALRALGFSNVSYWEFAGGDHGLRNFPWTVPLMLDWLNGLAWVGPVQEF